MTKTKNIIALSIMLSVLATTLILPILAPLMRELGLSVVQAGMMLSIGSVAMVIAAPLWGHASERWGRKTVIVCGFGGIFAGYVLYTLAVMAGLSGSLSVFSIFAGLTASRALVGVFLSAVPTGAQALMADLTTAADRSGGMAIIGAATGLGLIAGPAVSGLLVPYGITWPLLGACALCFTGFLAAATLLKDAPIKAAEQTQRQRLFSTALFPWFTSGVLLWVAIATTQISAGFYFQEKLGLDTQSAVKMLSIALTLVGAAMFAVQLLQVRVLSLSPRFLVLGGAFLWVAGLSVLLLTNDAMSYYAAYTLLGIGAGSLMPGVMAGASLASGDHAQGSAAGLVAATQGIGFIIAPAASTILYQWDKAMPFQVLIVLMSLLFLKFLFVRLPEHAANNADAQHKPLATPKTGY